MKREITRLEFQETISTLLAMLLFFSFVGLGINFFTNQKNENRITELEQMAVYLDNEWTMLNYDDYLNLSELGCKDFDLFVRYNETGNCLRPLNQMNNSQIYEIWNVCPQDIVVRCYQ